MATLAIPTDAPPVPGPPQGQWTIADWEALPDDGNRYEIIEGVIYGWADIPSIFHQWIVQKLLQHVGFPTEEHKFGYAIHQVGILMPGCDPVQPDLVVVLKERKSIIRDRRIMGVPDLIVEVMSPGSITYDQQVKLPAYAKAGVPEYGVVDPAKRQLSLYQLEMPGRYFGERVFGEDDSVTFACLPEIPVLVGKLFEGAPDTTL